MKTQPNDNNDPSWDKFLASLERTIGVPLAQYKEPQMKRRLNSLMTRNGIADWPDFTKALAEDGELLTVVRDTLTINVSEFFRQPDRFLELETKVLPELLKAGRPLSIWSAGCSIGCEPYSLAMILDSMDPRGRHTILATDVDIPAMSQAKDAKGYQEAEVRAVPDRYLTKYFKEEEEGYSVAADIKSKITFRRHDLLKDAYPKNVDLIVCRNVVIYFKNEAKNHIYNGFAAALRPDGMLFIGGSEMIMGSREIGLNTMSTSMYQRAA
jgi:chemotaxis protein methyltransferase CheR